jgi:hypothetical protein
VRFSKLEGGKIHLLADTSTWAAKLRMLSFVVLTEVRRLGFNDITELQVRVSRTLCIPFKFLPGEGAGLNETTDSVSYNQLPF